MQKTIMETVELQEIIRQTMENRNQESKYESDLNKSTARVNSTTGLKDGVYTPDSFSWSGGTGKVSITCSKVTVTGGQAYATITFSSPHYQYVKANGNVYYPSAKTGSSNILCNSGRTE